MGRTEDFIGRMIIALDYASAVEAESLLTQLKGFPCYMKVGMQLFYAAGPSFILKLKEQGYKVFLDLKMHDIPNTVKGGAASITRLGVDMFNVHAAGGVIMMESALEGVDQAVNASNPKPLVIGVTQLTSTNVTTLNEEIGISGTVEASVLHYAMLAKNSGLDGVVASPLEVTNIKEQNGSNFVTVTPGIRPLGFNIGDQSRVMTPKEAFNQGTDYIVIGRPITASDDPRKSIENIIEELK